MQDWMTTARYKRALPKQNRRTAQGSPVRFPEKKKP